MGDTFRSVRTQLMAKLLFDVRCDLSDEREVIRLLQQGGFAHGDIVAFADDAIEQARVMRQKSASLGDVA